MLVKDPLAAPLYLAQGKGLWAVPVEGFFEGPQPGLSNADLIPQDELRVSPGADIFALVNVSHSRAGKDFNRAATKPGLS